MSRKQQSGSNAAGNKSPSLLKSVSASAGVKSKGAGVDSG